MSQQIILCVVLSGARFTQLLFEFKYLTTGQHDNVSHLLPRGGALTSVSPDEEESLKLVLMASKTPDNETAQEIGERPTLYIVGTVSRSLVCVTVNTARKSLPLSSMSYRGSGVCRCIVAMETVSLLWCERPRCRIVAVNHWSEQALK